MYFQEEQAFIKQAIKIEGKLYEDKSNYQKIEVYQSSDIGNILVLDENAMLSEKDEFIYHEMLSHVPLCTHKDPKKVLIIGGGDGGTAREVLKHKDIYVDLVEIDEKVIETSKKYFKNIGDWDNDRLNVVIEDGMKYVSNLEDKSYDVILVDSTDDKDFASPLFDQTFYAQSNRVLKDDGLLAVQGSSYFIELKQHKNILTKLGNLFPIVMPYRYEMICYPGVVWNFILASKKYHPTADLILQRSDLLEGLKYYNSDIHKASFAVPTKIKKELLGIIKN